MKVGTGPKSWKSVWRPDSLIFTSPNLLLLSHHDSLLSSLYIVTKPYVLKKPKDLFIYFKSNINEPQVVYFGYLERHHVNTFLQIHVFYSNRLESASAVWIKAPFSRIRLNV